MKIAFRRKTILIVFGLLLLFLSLYVLRLKREGTKGELPNVIMITFSGVRSIDSIDDVTHQYVPRLWNELRKEGTLYTNVIDLNYQFHMPVVSAILTGQVYSWNNKLIVPSIFQYVRKQYKLPISKVWSFGDWMIDDAVYKTIGYGRKTFPCQVASLQFKMSPETQELLSEQLNTQEKVFLERFNHMTQKKISTWPQWDSLGDVQFALFEKVFKKFKPVMVHYVMNDVEGAHYGSYARYVLSLKKSDERIYQIWQWIQNDPEYKDNTYLIVTVDHQRNVYYMDHHDNDLKDPSPVWIYIYGPNVKKNIMIDREVHHIDIFKTVSFLLGLKTHDTRGNVLADCFDRSDTSESP